MRSLLSSVHDRQLRLIELLNTHKSGLSIDTLTETLSCSERLIREDISGINKNSETLTLLSEKGYVYIKYKRDKNIDSVIQSMFNQTSGLQILEYIFNNENLTPDDLAGLCGVSTSTIYRIVNKVNQVMTEHYGIQVSHNPCRLTGDERDIRNFYTHYFLEKYLAYQWPFDSIDETAFETFFKDILKNPLVNFSYAEFRFIKLSAAVSYVRWMNGHSVDFSGMRMNNYFIEKINNMPAEVKLRHDKFLKSETNLNFIRQLFHLYSVEGFYISYTDLIEGSAVNTTTRKSVNAIDNLITGLKQEFNLALPDVKKLTLEVHNICYLSGNSSNRNYLIRHQSAGLLDTMKKLNPQFFRRAAEEAEKYTLAVWKSDSRETINNVVYTLIASWDKLYSDLRQRKKTVSVLICSIAGKFQAEMIKESLKYEFNDKLSIEIYNGFNFKIKEIEALGHDICITDFSVENTGERRWLCLSDLPSAENIFIIRNMIEEIQASK